MTAIIKKYIIKTEIISLTKLFESFSSQTKIKILYLLMDTGIWVKEVSILIDMTPSDVYRQLAILKKSVCERLD